MAQHEKIFGNIMLGLIAGLIMWAFGGSFFALLFRDDLSLIGHPGIRAATYIYDDYVDNGF